MKTENDRLKELMKAALDVLNAHRDEKHAVPARVRPQERLLEDAFETCGCMARFAYYTGPRPEAGGKLTENAHLRRELITATERAIKAEGALGQRRSANITDEMWLREENARLRVEVMRLGGNPDCTDQCLGTDDTDDGKFPDSPHPRPPPGDPFNASWRCTVHKSARTGPVLTRDECQELRQLRVRTHNEQFRYSAMVGLYEAARTLYRAYTKRNRPAVVAALYASTREALRAFKRQDY